MFYKHVAPLGLVGYGYPVFYKHIAPVGLWVDGVCRWAINLSRLWGYSGP